MKNLQMINLKTGSEYSRDDLYYLYFNKPRPKGGDWDTVHVVPKNTNDFLVFLNIGVAGTTGHNFENKYDQDKKILEWYGKPDSHAKQPTYVKLFSKELTPHFFVRRDNKNKNFLYLGTGSNIDYQDDVKANQGNDKAIKLRYLIHELDNKEDKQLLNVGSTIMKDKEIDKLDKVVESLNTMDDTYSSSMGRLLDYYSNRDSEKFAHSAMMGGTESYVASVSLLWFANNVRFASELPLFERNKNEEDNIIINEETADKVYQRPLDWSRQAQLTQYLITSPKHKFPPALVVISQPWVDDPNSDEWDEDGKALVSSASFKKFDSQGKFGMLDVSDSMQIFALDGQHRLLGIQGLKKLINGEPLTVKNRFGTDQKDKITVDLLKERFNVDRAYIQSLGSETMGVEFISAVSEGETREEARQRVRSIFVHVNKQAQKLKQGDLAQLDEDNGFTIVGRNIAVSHKLLVKHDRVNFHDKQISVRSTKFTTLVAVTEMTRNLLLGYFLKWDPMIKGVPPQRPSEEHLEYGQKIVALFFDKLANLPSVSKMVNGTPTADLRNFPKDPNEVDPLREPENPGEANILFRPIGQQALARAIGEIISEESEQPVLADDTLDQSALDDISVRLDKLFDQLTELDEQGAFAYMNEPNSLWYGVLYDWFNKKIRVKGEKLAVLLIKYLLRGTDEKDRENLRKAIADVRYIEDDVYRNFDGNKVSQDKIKLPNRI